MLNKFVETIEILNMLMTDGDGVVKRLWLYLFLNMCGYLKLKIVTILIWQLFSFIYLKLKIVTFLIWQLFSCDI